MESSSRASRSLASRSGGIGSPSAGAVARSWLGALLLAAAAEAQEPAPVSQPAAPARFERVLWCADTALGPELAKRLGFTAVQLGRGADPAPLRALGLSFYLDQPIGKGLLELRDDDWRPVAQGFERDRDAAALRRPTCFAAPSVVEAAAAAAAAEARRVHGPGLLFVALADEPSATRHDAPSDSCRCEHCLAAFRRYLGERFGTVERVNEAFGSHFASLEAAVPLATDQVRRRELGDRLLPADLRAWSIWLDFVDAQYAGAAYEIGRLVGAAAPHTPIGLTGQSAPAAFGGNDPALLYPWQTVVEPYDIGGAVELALGMAPTGAHRYRTLQAPTCEPRQLVERVRAEFADMACHGLAGVVVWNDAAIAAGDGEASPFGSAVRAAWRALGPTLDACAGARLEPSSIWVVESQASVRAWWMLDSAGDGMTWPRRLASYEATHSTSQAARRGWVKLLRDLGCQPRFVPEQWLAGRLLLDKPRCVVLPATLALGDRATQALDTYVRAGGTLLADHSTALYDDQLRRRERGGLDRLFGVEQRSLANADLLVLEGEARLRAGADAPPAERGLRGAMSDRGDDTDRFLEHAHGRGRTYYLNVPVAAYASWRLDEQRVAAATSVRRAVRAALGRCGVAPPCEVRGEGLPTCVERVVLRLRDGRRVVAVRLDLGDRPELLHTIAARGATPVEVQWPEEVEVKRLGADAAPVRAARTEAQLDPFGALWFEVGR